ELDEKLRALYLEQGEELSPEQLHDPFEQALREGHLVPVCFASAESGAGMPELLQVFERLMPNPAEGNAPPFLKGAGEAAVRVAVTPDPAKHVIAHVFKVSIDPYVGKLGVLRVHQGTVRQGSQLFVGDARKPIKIAHLYRLLGKETTEIGEAVPGDICAIAKVDELHLDAVLHDSHDEDQYHLKPVAFPPAMLGVAIQPERRGDEQRLADTLHKLTAEDPCVRIEHHAAVNETVLYGMGEFHVRVLLERMSERYGVQVKTHPPSIPYRETVTRPAEGHCRHKKQTGGAGQFGEVYLRIEALARGAGFEFVDDVVGGAIPGQYIPAIEKGVRQVLTEGALAGFPIQDVRVTVYDGKHHRWTRRRSPSCPRAARPFSMRSRRPRRSCSSPSCASRSPLPRARSATSRATSLPSARASTATPPSPGSGPRCRPSCRSPRCPSTSRASRPSPAGRAPTRWSSATTIRCRRASSRSSRRRGSRAQKRN